jgi:putrescine transport system permease protein
MTAPSGFRRTVISAPMLWLAAFFLLPFLIVLAISLVASTDGEPPFASPLNLANLTLDSYRLLASDDLYIVAFAD